MARPQTFSFLLLCMFYVYWYSDSMSVFKQEGREVRRERAIKERVIDAESLRCSAEHIAKIQILSLSSLFLTLYSRQWRPEDFVRRRRRRWEFSFLFSSLPPPTPSLTNTHTYLLANSIRWGIEEHERDPACFWIFRYSNSQYVV